VTDYFEGALSEEERIRFEEHIDRCEGCHVYLEQMRRTVELTGFLTEKSMPREVQERLLGVFRGWKRA
jgi:anti-sigma factor RsiW